MYVIKVTNQLKVVQKSDLKKAMKMGNVKKANRKTTNLNSAPQSLTSEKDPRQPFYTPGKDDGKPDSEGKSSGNLDTCQTDH